ncbi:MAG: ATP-binding protein [Proteiniphilum sp.]|nr:ATP-binding protein [Bacteroidaceae bacterium]NLX79967.1 ATP-binding protein [Proteiniphilum sp.]NLZ69649.1 ATP-binding protein [Spirochaetales bacterium]
MKLLKIRVSGLPLFGGTSEIDFTALQRVTEENADKMNCLFSNGIQKYYQNNVLSFIGVNASGKTTLLKLITFVCRMLNNEPINRIDCREFLDGVTDKGEVVLDTFFYAKNNSVNLLHTVIGKKADRFIIMDETLKSKPVSKVVSKKDMFAPDGFENVMSRDNNEAFLLDDVSIMIAVNKKTNDQLIFTDMLRYTNINQLSISEDCPAELIAFFDSSIESLRVKDSGKDTVIRLTFKNKDEIKLNQLSELNRYLSSGTIKGINTFLNAIKTFKQGGYLIVDELENHFNHEIVSTLIRFYMDKKVNPDGAMLIFSTHYSELLDEFERNDNIYIVRNRDGITAENLSTILKRNDIKKSEAYQSGFLDGTVPMYDAYMDLKKSVIRAHKEG